MEGDAARKGDHHRIGRSFLEGALVNGAAERIFRWLDGRELLRFSLLAAVLGAVVYGIAPSIFRSETSLLLSAVLFGLSLGWITGRIPLPAAAAGLIDAALGIDFLFLAIGRLDLPVRNAAGSIVRFLQHLLPQNAGSAFDVGPLAAEAYRIAAGSASLIVRVRDWAASILLGDSYFDPVASAFFWSLALVLVGAFAGWVLSARRKPIAAVLPAVLLLAGCLSSGRGDWRNVVATVALVYLMVVVVEQSQKEQDWDRRNMGYSTSIRWDILFTAAPVLGFLLAAAYVFPSVSVDEIRQWIREQTRPQAVSGNSAGESLGLAPAGPGRTGSSQTEGFPLVHNLGRGPDLTRDVALVVVTGEAMQYLPGVREPVAPHHYWRAFTYDIYSGSGWLSSPTEERELAAGGQATEVDPSEGILLHQAVTVSRPGDGPLYYAGELVAVNGPYRTVSRSNFDLLGIVVPGAEYEADSMYREAAESALRSAGMEYPEWIRRRYLQLPNSLPERVHALARDLTATSPTPYDRALAIQNYLRREMRYSLEVNAPPYDRDVVDYFLFDSKKGFCEYYATAMAVLARSAGIPARAVFGFAAGTFDPVRGKFTILESDAHAWPELYFPGIGWVEFEPTASMPEIPRAPAAGTDAARPIAPGWTGGRSSAFVTWLLQILQRNTLPAVLLLLAVPVCVLLWNLAAPLRFRLIPPARLLRFVYRGLRAHGARQGIRFSPGTTPGECMRLLAQRNPACAAPLGRMGELYSRWIYGGKALSAAERKEIIRCWPGLDRRLWRAWWNHRFSEIRRVWRAWRGGGENQAPNFL
jgi:transglutaminase-like putative cysteine protease